MGQVTAIKQAQYNKPFSESSRFASPPRPVRVQRAPTAASGATEVVRQDKAGIVCRTMSVTPLLCPFLLVAQIDDAPSLDADRPDFTEAAVVVPRGALQLEFGLTHQSARGARSISGPEALARYGLAERVELRFGLPDHVCNRVDGVRSSGWADGYLGAKIQLGPLPNGDDLALVPGFSIPSRSEEFSSRAADPELLVCWSRDLSDGKSIATTTGIGWPTEDGRRRASVFQTFVYGFEVDAHVGAFVEWVGAFAPRAEPEYLFHTGLTYRLSPGVQFDLHGGITLNGSDRRPFVGIGAVVRT